MENASKALLMAAGILIGILILTLTVYLWRNISSISDTYNVKTTTEAIEKFNTNFTVFSGREDITAQEIVSLNNFVSEQSRNVSIDGVTITDTINFLQNNSYDANGKVIHFKCIEITYSQSTGYVNSITFEKM